MTTVSVPTRGAERGCDFLDLVSFDRYEDDIAAADLRRLPATFGFRISKSPAML